MQNIIFFVLFVVLWIFSRSSQVHNWVLKWIQSSLVSSNFNTRSSLMWIRWMFRAVSIKFFFIKTTTDNSYSNNYFNSKLLFPLSPPAILRNNSMHIETLQCDVTKIISHIENFKGMFTTMLYRLCCQVSQLSDVFCALSVLFHATTSPSFNIVNR